MDYEIFDFHTHPFYDEDDNTCVYKDLVGLTQDVFIDYLNKAEIKGFAGSVISNKENGEKAMHLSNIAAFKLKEFYGDRYIPGITVDPRYLDESINEIDKAYANGCNLIGELVPYYYGWSYKDESFRSLLDHNRKLGMVVSLHTCEIEAMELLAKDYKDTTFVFAHPGEKNRILQHIDIMKQCENVYLDLSGTGLFRFGMLKKLVHDVGAERILFGTDYPICNPFMYVHGVLGEGITLAEKEMILSKNSKRLLKIN